MIKKYESNLDFWVVLCNSVQMLKSKDINMELNAIEMIRNKVYKMKGELKDWHKK
jgi:hypothetical protein